MFSAVKNNYRPLLIGSALGLLLLASLATVGLYGVQRASMSAATAQAIGRLPPLFDDAMQRDADLFLNLMTPMLDDPALQSAWRDRDRDRLLALTEKRFGELNNRHHLTHLYFTDLDRINVLRVHDPLHAGDVINRDTTLKALELKQDYYGVELGVFGSLTLRLVHPWTINGRLAGLVEFGEELDHLTPRLDQQLGMQMHYLIDKSQVQRSGWQNGMNLFHHHHWNTLPDHLIVGRANAELIQAWKPLLTAATGTKALYDLEAGKRFYQAGLTDLIDVSGDTIGKMLLLRDITTERLALMRNLLRNGLIAAAVAIALWSGLFLHLRHLSRGGLPAPRALLARHSGEDILLHGGRFPDALVQIDMEGYVCGWNTAAERLFNTPRLEALGRHCHFIFDPASLPDLKASLITPLLNDGGATMEARLCRRNGGVFDGRLSCSVIYDAEHRPCAITGVIGDLSVHKQALAQTHLDLQKAQLASRAKSDFIARLSHELRTPVNAILGFGQLLKADTRERLAHSQQESVAEIVHAGEHVLDLLNEALDLTRIEAGKMQVCVETVSLREVFNECCGLIRSQAAARRIRVDSASVTATSLQVTGDHLRLKQVLLNLLSNAVKYNHDEGRIRLACRLTDDQRVRIEISDTGRGIAAVELARLFTPFERLPVHQHIQGAGIGLVLSKSLVELMDGCIGVDSTPGEGSRFWIELPAAQAAIATQTMAPESPVGGFKILCVEDNPANLKLVRQLLMSFADIEFYSAPNGELGCSMALAELPDLILLDINLPDINGYQVLRRLRESPQLANTPIIAVSANAMESDIRTGLELGFNEYLTKPINIAQFRAAVERYRPARPVYAATNVISLAK